MLETLMQQKLDWVSSENLDFPLCLKTPDHIFTIELKDPLDHEDVYTVYQDGVKLGSIQEWPELWTRPPASVLLRILRGVFKR